MVAKDFAAVSQGGGYDLHGPGSSTWSITTKVDDVCTAVLNSEDAAAPIEAITIKVDDVCTAALYSSEDAAAPTEAITTKVSGEMCCCCHILPSSIICK